MRWLRRKPAQPKWMPAGNGYHVLIQGDVAYVMEPDSDLPHPIHISAAVVYFARTALRGA